MLDLVLFNTVVNAIFNVGMILYMIYKVISMIKNIHKLWLFFKKCCSGIYWLYNKTVTFFFNKRNNQNGYQQLNQNENNDESTISSYSQPWYKRIQLPFFKKKSPPIDINNTISLSLISSEINSTLTGDDAMERRYFQLQRDSKYKGYNEFQDNSLHGSMLNNGPYYYNNSSNSSYMDHAVESQFVNERTAHGILNERRFSNVYNNYTSKYQSQSKSNENTSKSNKHEINVNMDSQYIQNCLNKMLKEDSTGQDIDKPHSENNNTSDVSIYIPVNEYLEGEKDGESDTESLAESEPPPEFTYDNYWKDVENVSDETVPKM